MVNPNVVPKVKLNNGLLMPIFGLGTWKSKPGEVAQAVKDAISAGYRHIDCAWIYKNENEVGAAIRSKINEKVVKREDLFITSKLFSIFHSPKDVEVALKESLDALGLEYLDLYLMHTPMGLKAGGELLAKDENGKTIPDGTDYIDTWKVMETLQKKGLVKSIGVSNFNKSQIERLLGSCTIKPVTNQVECHPYLNQKKLAEYCESKGIKITAYSPLGSPDRPNSKPDDPILLEDENLKKMGQKYQKTAAQVVIRYLIQRGLITIPKSVNKERLKQNINVFDFELTPGDFAYIDSLDRNTRYVDFLWSKHHPNYPFNDEY